MNEGKKERKRGWMVGGKEEDGEVSNGCLECGRELVFMELKMRRLVACLVACLLGCCRQSVCLVVCSALGDEKMKLEECVFCFGEKGKNCTR